MSVMQFSKSIGVKNNVADNNVVGSNGFGEDLIERMISLVVFIACLTAAHATCSCKQFESVKEAFCQSEYVLLARVLSINGRHGELSTNASNSTDTTDSGTWSYNIWHLRTWKGPVVATSALTTPNSESECGVTGLLQGWDYFLTGKKGKHGEITFTSCDVVMPWYQVTSEEIELLRELREDPKECGKNGEPLEENDETKVEENGEETEQENDEKKVEENDEKTEEGNDEKPVEENDEKKVEENYEKTAEGNDVKPGEGNDEKKVEENDEKTEEGNDEKPVEENDAKRVEENDEKTEEGNDVKPGEGNDEKKVEENDEKTEEGNDEKPAEENDAKKVEENDEKTEEGNEEKLVEENDEKKAEENYEKTAEGNDVKPGKGNDEKNVEENDEISIEEYDEADLQESGGRKQ
ncbi:hypothetical protein ANCCAN_24259 [Ancylostoma caninum]|uniref:NTR domain-containing protein n=1 Tax=Ancylostoma caninum TaxID=29170 RepID=A0A368FCV7_ANCCA|nr:hypothetical protein ANCCAN_24259 [Ancylostoma caninum]